MRKTVLAALFISISTCFILPIYFSLQTSEKLEAKFDGKEEEDGILEAQKQEFQNTQDIHLGYIPKNRLVDAYQALMRSRKTQKLSSLRTTAFTWSERGPTADAVGPTNGNGRPGNGIASGRIRAIWVDLADVTNKTVWIGGIDGGLWKTSDITSSPATWTPVNDFFANLAISAITQDPSNTNIMYFGTGEKAFNVDAVRGGGVWKSTDHGVTWNLLANTTGFWNVSKIVCDGSGNVYVATLGAGSGLQRSTDGGTTWTNITPTGLSTRVTEMKISNTGRLHIVCGYFNTAAASAGYRYTDVPSTVTSGTWTAPATSFPAPQYNCELGTNGNTVYALSSNSSFQTPTIYKSTDGGANWAATTASPPAASGNNDLSSGQGWYCLALAVDPANANNVIVGGLNCYKTTNGGTSWSQVSVWVSGISAITNYIHADQHIAVWTGSQVMVGSDGGLFYSSDGATTFSDRNNGLRIKQFYSVAVHPTTTNYFLGGAQDNGCHQLTTAGLGSSTEVTGGDGAFVHIDQDEPQYQFGSYVYNDYRRSTDGGATWSSVTYSTSVGQFINPTDYDNTGNKLYASGAAGQYVRWDNPQTGNTFAAVSIAAFAGGSVTSVKVSDYSSNTVYFGTSGGKIVKVTNANQASPTASDITDATMSASTVSCVENGTDDNNLIASFSNYGSAHVWVTSSGGTAGWVNITGNLPDIPVRWCMFYPDDNTKAMIATEMGIFETTNINGASTVWVQDPGFPTVRTDMLQYRRSDGLVAAATHGRGIWTCIFPPSAPYVRFASPSMSQSETGAVTNGCRRYKDYTVNLTIDMAPVGDAAVNLAIAGGTATQGLDYDFTTNGNFATPSSTLTFANGSTTSQPLTIRIYDDADVEGTETFQLNYSITGATNALVAPSSQTLTFTINDNDVAPVVPFTGTFSVGTYNANLGSTTPFRSNLQKHRIQVLFLASELQAAGLNTATNINSMTLRIVTKGSTKAYTGFTVAMMNTGATNVNTGFIGGTYTQVYSGNYTTAVGNNLITFTSPFAWDGSSNVVVQFCFDNTPSAADAAADVAEGNSAPLGAGNHASIFSNGGAGAGCSLAAALVSDFRINATFSAASGNPVASLLNTSTTEYFANNNDIYYYSSSGEIIARIHNLSGFNYGCSQVIVDRAGTGAAAFWSNTPANYLMAKTFHVIPAANNPTGQYQITLYFTAAEKAGWEAATGQLWNNIQLVKVPSQISNYTPATPAPDGAGAVLTVTPVFGTYGSDYTLSYTFTNGFSGFGAGIPGSIVLPVSITNFEGHPDHSNINLSWLTSNEVNTKNFIIEKSTEGSNYSAIGTVAAIGESVTSRKYGFVDDHPNADNYYRLRIYDRDGKNKLSQIVHIKLDNPIQNAWVVNNPFRNDITVRTSIIPQQKITCELLSISGARMLRKEYAPASEFRIDLSNINIPSGVYTLKMIIDNKVYVRKVIRQ